MTEDFFLSQPNYGTIKINSQTKLNSAENFS